MTEFNFRPKFIFYVASRSDRIQNNVLLGGLSFVTGHVVTK